MLGGDIPHLCVLRVRNKIVSERIRKSKMKHMDQYGLDGSATRYEQRLNEVL